MQANSTTPIKDIRYSDGEWHVYVDGEYRGSRRSSFLAEELANEVAYNIILATAPVASEDEMSDWQRDPEEETGPQEEGGPGGYPPPDDRTPSVAGLTIHDLADVAWLCERHDYTLEDALAAVVAFNAATEPDPPTPPAAPAARPVTREAA